jgi:hypothetical protein
MAYRYERERRDHNDLAAGRVLHGARGATAFPVRLASELAQRAFAAADLEQPLVYDPCCGSGYLLTVVGFLHGNRLAGLIASDVSPEAVSLCTRNLALLDAAGLGRREARLRHDLEAFGKPAHRDALASCDRLRRLLPGNLPRRTFVADAGDPGAVAAGLGLSRPDLVLTDLPYGRLADWSGTAAGAPSLLGALARVLRPGAVVGLAGPRTERPAHGAYETVERWQLGRRALAVLRRC